MSRGIGAGEATEKWLPTAPPSDHVAIAMTIVYVPRPRVKLCLEVPYHLRDPHMTRTSVCQVIEKLAGECGYLGVYLSAHSFVSRQCRQEHFERVRKSWYCIVLKGTVSFC